MNIDNKKPVYEIDSCFEKIKYQTRNICNRPSYHTVCKKPIVDRNLLTRDDYLKMLSTPRGFKWPGITSYYNKYSKDYIKKMKTGGPWKQYIQNDKHKINDSKKGINIYQQKNELKKRKNTKSQYEKQKLSILNNNNFNSNTVNASKLKNYNETIKSKNTVRKNKINSNGYKMEDYLKNENNFDENLKKIKEQRKMDYILNKKKQLWLLSEKKRKKREERENKFKSTLQAKRKAHEEFKKKMEEKLKLKTLHEKMLKKKQKIEEEKKEAAKQKSIAQKAAIERAKFKEENEKNLRLEAFKKEAKRIVQEEEAWRNKINRKFAQKMGYRRNPNNHILSVLPNIVNNENEYSIGKTGKEIFTTYTKNLLEKKKKNDQVFDPGNLTKQIIKKELNTAKNRQAKLKNRMGVYDSLYNQENNMIKIQNKKENQNNLKKSVVFKKHYRLNNMVNYQNLNSQIQVKSYEHCVPFINKKVSKCKIPSIHCYSNTSFNTIVCHWKNEMGEMIENMRKRRHNFVKIAKTHNQWK